MKTPIISATPLKLIGEYSPRELQSSSFSLSKAVMPTPQTSQVGSVDTSHPLIGVYFPSKLIS
jgi:hypothetical protein